MILLTAVFGIYVSSCTHFTHRTLSADNPFDSTKSDQDPNYNVSLDFNYQDFTSYLFPGNRVENFTAYFNTFYRSKEDFNLASDEYRSSLISFYNRRLDSLGTLPILTTSVKDKLDKAIERSSKIIQFHKNSKFIDDAVLIIGKSYYYETDYYKAERTFNEFISKFSSSDLADEAILFLGRTKFRLGKTDEAIAIFKDLVEKSDNYEVQSQATRDLGILAYNRGNSEDAVNYFKSSIDYSKDKERKAEEQFILAKILSEYKPELAAAEYKKVLDYSSDYDLLFYARLNYAKGLITNKDYRKASEELDNLRSKYRDESAFTQLVDLEIANNLYDQEKYAEALEKYYEVIVRYPNSSVSSDAYYSIAKHEEEINKNYLKAFVNYKKATEESASSDFYKESSAKSETFQKYFNLLDEVSGDSAKTEIPTVNADVERFRRSYNEEKGIETIQENRETPRGNEDDTGTGKGKPGGSKYFTGNVLKDSVEDPVVIPEDTKTPEGNEQQPIDENLQKEMPKELPEDEKVKQGNTDTIRSITNDSIKAAQELLGAKIVEDKLFNAYYELAELFIYNLNQQDSAEHYLKLLLSKFPESENQAKILYTLGNFYKNNSQKQKADDTFNKIISDYPNTIYANESRKILGLKVDEVQVTQSPSQQYFNQAVDLFKAEKYPEALTILHGFVQQYPGDSLSAKSLYAIGWIYENKIFNKDSSVFYYKKLKAGFPQSDYTQKIISKLEYIASVEPKDSTAIVSDSTATDRNTIIEDGAVKDTLNTEVKKEENNEEVKIDPEKNTEENRLSQEEIDRLLKETETPPDPK